MKTCAEAEPETLIFRKSTGPTQALPLGEPRFSWSDVKRVLVVRLRSIGDAVLATPTLYALRRFLPHAQINILLEDWVAPLLDGCVDVDRVIAIKPKSSLSRARLVPELRAAGYDVAINLHGGTTATLLTRASGAKHRIGYASYQYSLFYNHQAPPAAVLWKKEKTHSAEQQLALPGWAGVPVSDRPRARLAVTPQASRTLKDKLNQLNFDSDRPYALLHPAASFASKQWAVEKFAGIAEHLNDIGLSAVAVAAPHEAAITNDLHAVSRVPLTTLTDLTLPEVTALASSARMFVGNDSGIAHIAAATGAPSVVIFGSSNVSHWHPWTDAPAEVVREDMPCAPCAGYSCSQFVEPECIKRVSVAQVENAIMRVLAKAGKRGVNA